MKLTKGKNLNAAQKREVLRVFTYRLTTENGYPERNPCHARVPAISDAQWIAEHAFWINEDGTLHHCKSAEPEYMA